MRYLTATDGPLQEPTDAALKTCLAAGQQGFWLDIEAPDDSDYQLLEQVFHFHPLTLEDVRHRNQRPKLEEFEGYNFIVLFTADRVNDETAIREHHLYLAPQFVVSIHLEPSAPLQTLRERTTAAPEMLHRGLPFLFYMVVDQLVDSLFPILDGLDDDTDQLADGILSNPNPASLARIQQMKHEVVDLHKVLGAQRDVFRQLTTHSITSPSGDMTVYFRDVYDHIVRQAETADSLRDLLSGTMDVYLSTVSNRLNDVMRRLTVIATIFMPLTFITGFFGMNFGWLVSNIASLGTFATAVAVMVASVVVQLAYFRRRGWV